jgi:hypothetical protein
MCIDYTDLNRHCPKDPFPLPRIDQVVDSTAASVLLCFINSYSGYHQIALKVSDQDNMVEQIDTHPVMRTMLPHLEKPQLPS